MKLNDTNSILTKEITDLKKTIDTINHNNEINVDNNNILLGNTTTTTITINTITINTTTTTTNTVTTKTNYY